MAEERYERFQERQLKMQEEFFEKIARREKIKKNRNIRDKENEEDSTS